MSQDKTERMEYFISLLDDYIDGKLGEGQTAEIEQALKEDTFLNEVLKQHVQARANMRVAGEDELRAKFADSFEPIPEAIEPKSNLLKILIPIVLILGLATAAYYFLSGQDQTQEQRPFTASVEDQDGRMLLASVEDPSYDLLRSDKDTIVAEIWQRAVLSFIDKDYSNVIGVLSTLEKDTLFVNDHLGKYSLMRGVSYLKLEEYQAAKEYLSKIDIENPYFDQAEWYLALTAYFSGSKSEALDRLTNISQSTEHFKSTQAKPYLEKLAN